MSRLGGVAEDAGERLAQVVECIFRLGRLTQLVGEGVYRTWWWRWPTNGGARSARTCWRRSSRHRRRHCRSVTYQLTIQILEGTHIVRTHAVLLMSVECAQTINIGVIVISVKKCTYWPCDLDLWPFNHKTTIFLGYPKVIFAYELVSLSHMMAMDQWVVGHTTSTSPITIQLHYAMHRQYSTLIGLSTDRRIFGSLLHRFQHSTSIVVSIVTHADGSRVSIALIRLCDSVCLSAR